MIEVDHSRTTDANNKLRIVRMRSINKALFWVLKMMTIKTVV